ncbi:MAG TPA: histidine triad nucleotide-binding protein, partial [Pirellulales bacterium]|nr:histidine triad nucleotide-binding protein [Pirellulales bacterium]
MKTIFKRIIDREIPADIVYEDDQCLAFRDISPQAPTHVLIIPKREIASIDAMTDADSELVAHLWFVIRDLARNLNLGNGYRVVINNGPEAGQSVDHLHLH